MYVNTSKYLFNITFHTTLIMDNAIQSMFKISLWISLYERRNSKQLIIHSIEVLVLIISSSLLIDINLNYI